MPFISLLIGNNCVTHTTVYISPLLAAVLTKYVTGVTDIFPLCNGIEIAFLSSW